jgi:hypothetical protein
MIIGYLILIVFLLLVVTNKDIIMIKYRIIKEVNGKQVSDTVLTDNQMDIVYNGLSAITDDIKDEDSPYYSLQDDNDLEDMFNRLYEVLNG